MESVDLTEYHFISLCLSCFLLLLFDFLTLDLGEIESFQEWIKFFVRTAERE